MEGIRVKVLMQTGTWRRVTAYQRYSSIHHQKFASENKNSPQTHKQSAAIAPMVVDKAKGALERLPLLLIL